jgi:hypothetical protein
MSGAHFVYGCVWCVSIFFSFLEGADVFVVLDFMLLPPSTLSHRIPLPPLPPRAAQACNALRRGGQGDGVQSIEAAQAYVSTACPRVARRRIGAGSIGALRLRECPW